MVVLNSDEQSGGPNESISNSVNPYAAIEVQDLAQTTHAVSAADFSMLRQVPIVATLSIVVGCLELLAGTLLVILGFFMSSVLSQSMESRLEPTVAEIVQPQEAESESEAVPELSPEEEAMLESFRQWGQGFYSVLGGVVIAVAVLRIVSGILALQYRGRKVMITSLFAGLLTTLTCYCGPFSVGLCIWGAIVFMHPAVVKAFRMVADGESKQVVRNRFEQVALGNSEGF